MLQKHAFLIVIALASFYTTITHAECSPPTLEESVLPREQCRVLHSICVDNEGALVTFDPEFYSSVNGSLGLDDVRSWGVGWNIPGNTNSDAIVGNQDAWTLQLRTASALEASPLLRRLYAELRQHLLQPQPGSSSSSSSGASAVVVAAATAASAPSSALWTSAFSRCTLPAVLLADWYFNYGEFLEVAATAATHLFKRQGLLPDRHATLVLATPAGLDSPPFHRSLLAHLTSRQILTLAELAEWGTAAEIQAAELGGAGGTAGAAEAAGVGHGGGGGGWAHHGGLGHGGHHGGGHHGGGHGGGHHPRVGWTGEGVAMRCFKKVVVCKLIGSPMPALETAAAVVQHLEATHGLAEDPLGFYPRKTAVAAGAAAATEGGGGAAQAAAAGAEPQQQQQPPTLHEDTTLRVVLEARTGPTRNTRNLHQLIEACDKWGADFKAGPFNRIACRALSTADTPDLHGGARFRHTLAVVRSAHVLVALHGAGAANALFLRTDGGGGGGGVAGSKRAATALLEVRPCGFGSRFVWWADVHMAAQLPRSGDAVHFHALNLEDPAQCSPADWMLAIKAPGLGTPNTRHGIGHAMRDQHVTLQPEVLRAMLEHVASLLRDPEGYRRAREEGKLHGYATPTPGTEAVELEKAAVGDVEVPAPAHGAHGGVVLGPPGLAPANMTAHLAGSPQWLLQPRSGR
ncbi:hypothetical protein HXX76_012185 [Chlamydomonas incerta]|uniref:Uncharacterized protein n=1 Tax=Chlamydomonas incerta TaxID=51695 RepID=A0A835SWL5_CHLIN|nr:hypothetical protein HXX76_012185 [Chlamydomonas incerta]|eukprot:KAG2427865.1 hypothetical protein HXX76_012185 [Chlamydomonas incerta]